MSQPVDYNRIAPEYDQRYTSLEFNGIEEAVVAFAAGIPGLEVLEVGCGTGHWLDVLRRRGASVAGLDNSEEMLRIAVNILPDVHLKQGDAQKIPWKDGSFDRVFCVNAIHHFTDGAAFVAEARKVLRDGGGLMVVGLDPSRGVDRTFVYDFFDGALETDLRRYPSTATVESWMAKAGFADVETRVAQHMVMPIPAKEALEAELIGRNLVSQLALLSDAVFAAGIDRIRQQVAAAESRGESFSLVNDVRFYATTGWGKEKTGLRF
jgi:SAM-dependent methyltransferase